MAFLNLINDNLFETQKSEYCAEESEMNLRNKTLKPMDLRTHFKVGFFISR